MNVVRVKLYSPANEGGGVCEGRGLVVNHGPLAGNSAGFMSGLCDYVAPFYPALQSLAGIGTLEASSRGGREEVVIYQGSLQQ